MTYLQLLEQLRSRDDRFRQSRVDQAVLEAAKNNRIRQESNVPPYAVKGVEKLMDDYDLNWWRWYGNTYKGKNWANAPTEEPVAPNQLGSYTMGNAANEGEVVIATEPRLRSYANRGGLSREQLVAHELRHKALDKMGYNAAEVDHHPMIEAMENISKYPRKYRSMTNPEYIPRLRDTYVSIYERNLRDKAKENQYLKLLRQMGYEY